MANYTLADRILAAVQGDGRISPNDGMTMLT
jgi:hypothetical protein